MSYTVLARKYRPQTFADLVGQEHVSRTLGNALQSGRVAHAFLFTGARGVGKTTTARLLAKALNCEQGPTATPCNQCDPCREITAGSDIDVLEIDGASNNGVDDVRRLQETLPFRPARDRFKIVIVDEVHMLSVGAFNAFLKTLEEPPAHVKFVFATTEIHKVPITIRSRCQRYDFRLIPHAVVAERVREILRAEQIVADDEAVALVAREAAGSMRDALTVLDQVLALGDTELHGESVARGLAIASRESVMRAVEALLSGDAAACLQCVSVIAEQGLDVLHFTKQLLECARDLVVLRVVGASHDGMGGVALTPDELARAKQLAEAHDRAELERLFAGLTKLIEEVGQAAMPQMTLEMGLVRLASRPPLVSVQELITRLKSFEDLLSGGPGPSGPTSAPFGGGGGGGGAVRNAPPRRAPSASSAEPRSDASAAVSDVAPRPASPGSSQLPRDASQARSPVQSSDAVAATQLREAATGERGPVQPSDAGAATPQLRDAVSVVRGPGQPSSEAAVQLRDAASVVRASSQPSGPAAVQRREAAPVSRAPAPQPAEAPRPPARLVSVPPPSAAARAPSAEAPAMGTHNLSAGAAAALRFSQSQALARSEEPVTSTATRPITASVPQPVAPPLNSPAPLSARTPQPANAAQTSISQPRAAEAPRPAPAAQGGADGQRNTLAAPAAVSGEAEPDSDWGRIVGVVRAAQPALAAVLNHGMPIEVTAATLRIGYPDGSFFGRQAQAASAREGLLRAAEQVFGARPNLLIGPPGEAKVSTLAEIEEHGRRQRSAAKREAALTHPAVLDAMEIFGESEASVDVQVDLE